MDVVRSIPWSSPWSATLRLATAAVLAAALAGMAGVAAFAQSEPDDLVVSTVSDELGTYLVDPDGRTLYFFTRDVTPGVSLCNGPCAENWPPLLVQENQAVVAGEGVTGVLGIVPRADGSLMATYDGRPLYHWKDDAAAGDVLGQGVGGVWFVAMADGSTPSNPPALTLELATSELGSYLTGRDGLTLYFFARDVTPGVSTCYDDCATAWPAATVPAGNQVAAGAGVAGVVGVVPRTDGTFQATYDGRPLYYWKDDAAAGDTLGHGVGGVWFVANEDGSLPAAPEG
jgi:predicted lipoprotein with Yx(FWY)xxD motif